MRTYLVAAIILAEVALFAACGGSGKNTTPKTDTSAVMGPAPDNNSANNPSLADTAYEKNRTRPITDTTQKK